MLKAILGGFILAVIIFGGALFYYFYSGMAPVATADASMPFEKKLAHLESFLEEARDKYVAQP